MLTPEQQARLARFRDDDQVEIVPFDPRCLERFEKLKAILKFTLGENIDVQLRGSSFLGISGKGELDIYISVPPEQFDVTVIEMERFLNSSPKSLYPLDRARFIALTDGVEDEIFVVNKEGKSWGKNLVFENYLLEHRDVLKEYERLKEGKAGLSTRAYYIAKEEFIGDILKKAGHQEKF